MGRWLTRDPIGFAGGVNPYAYCDNDPVNFVDPLGLLDVQIGGFEFTDQGIADGLQTGLAATGSAFSFGLWDGGQYRCEPGFATSAVLAGIGRDALLAAATMGESAGLEAAEEAGSVGIEAAEEGESAEAAETCADGVNCFVAGTPVQMADGTTKPIEQVKVGDSVLSRDSDDTSGTGAVTAHKVVQTFKHEASDGTVVLHLAGGESIECTAGHRFFVEGRGFTQASLIAAGSNVVTKVGLDKGLKPGFIAVERVEHKSGKAAVYNLEVAQGHSFFVGNTSGGIWVHNACGGNSSGVDLMGHGTYSANDGWVAEGPPEGTEIHFYVPHDTPLDNDVANAIVTEGGEPVEIVKPGEPYRNYRLTGFSPEEIEHVVQTPTTYIPPVGPAQPLSSLLQANMGIVRWLACRVAI